MRPIKNYLIFVAALIALSSNTQAYEAKTVHEPLLNTALTIYNECFPGDTMYDIVEDAKSRVIAGNIAMDEGLKFNIFDVLSLRGEKVFSKAKRPFNWHFYNPNKEDMSRAGLVEQSHIRLWQGLKDGLKSNEKNYNKLLFIGGLIHLVEDITSPAHVVPVYHGPTVISVIGPKTLKPLVTYMQEYKDKYKHMIKDNIDYIAPDTQRLLNELQHDNLLCHEIDTNSETLEEIRFNAATKTLNLLKQEIPECPNFTWQEFWTPPKSDEYFGKYYIKNNSPLFGQEGLMTLENGSTCKFKENDPRYEDFVYSLHLNAVKADLKLLNWSTKNILKRDKKSQF
ncbi:MAG: hypothetical protein OQK48_00875 [Sulfurimonas sp.]|uniref:hypothetical protein n=1 Tax=Sulfurimonas sp. TaxID=2022749 RepID=UPI00260E083E|nr:hypothetical protein [Sulfurimonas sp.]MCW8894418.1 hypothetical protein [Sulfurimonas sp.]MCW8953477.1 hypothetical protein [Sulfurimonas sp.]MCW9068355.1 hypothetical protein [Sulfurimonas sp.]